MSQIFTGTAITTRADGRQDTFTSNAGTWQADPDVTSRLYALTDGSGNQTGWQLVSADDTTETYSLSGQLMSVTSRAGLTTTLTYDGNGYLIGVTGPFRQTLGFTNDSSGRVYQMTAPDGGVYTYGYDANNNLVSVTHPDGSLRQYQYGNSAFPHALTGIIDEDGNAYAGWTYDSLGRAVTSQHAGGVDLTTVTYNADGTSSATDADGNTHTYALTTNFNLVQPSAISGAPYAPAGGQAYTYDGNGFVQSKTDFDGNITTYTHDSRGDQLTRTEASGTSVQRTISTQWLPNYHLPQTISEPGRTTSFGYDGNGNLQQKTVTTASASRSWSYMYNGQGQAITATDARGDTTRYGYNSAGELASITDPLGHVTAYTSYDADGRPLSMTDPNGLVTTLTYNWRGQIISRNAGGELTSYTYDPAGQLIKLTRPDGSFFTFTHDPAHRLTQVANAAGGRIVYSYDLNSNITGVQVFNGGGGLARTRSYTYNQLNLVAKAIGSQGQTTTFSYDPNSNLTGVTDPLSHTTAYAYDALNRLAQAIDPEGGTTGLSYDPLGELLSVVDPRGLTTKYAWDGLDDQTGVTSPDSGTTVRTFDAAGNLATSTDARGLTTAYVYDALNRRVQEVYASNQMVTWRYDQGEYGIGHLTSMADLSGHTLWGYDQHGRVIAKFQNTVTTPRTTTLTTRMSYDSAGRLRTLTYPSGTTVGVAYDRAGGVSALTSGGVPLVSGVIYQAFGPVSGWTWGNGAVYSRSFDHDGEITGIGLANGSMALAYDAGGRITGISETGLSDQSFAYDALNRLTGYTSGGASQTYGYDADGSRTSLNNIAYSIDPASNRLLSAGGRTFGYDADGHVITDNGMAALGFTYDASGRLVAAKTGGFMTSYTNDGLGERVTRSGFGASDAPSLGRTARQAGRFTYDQVGHLIGEYSGTQNAVLEETVWLGDLPVATLMPGQSPYYIAPDQLGAPHQITDASRNAVWNWDHDPFGNGKPGGSRTYNLRFPGQYNDQETGLNYNMLRDYEPTTGRYIESDPIGLGGGINTYAYVGENPLWAIDSRGTDKLTPWDIFNPDGTISPRGLSNSRMSIPSSKIGNMSIPRGYSKWSTKTYCTSEDSPYEYETHFYRNDITGEPYYGQDYKTVPSGDPEAPNPLRPGSITPQELVPSTVEPIELIPDLPIILE